MCPGLALQPARPESVPGARAAMQLLVSVKGLSACFSSGSSWQLRMQRQLAGKPVERNTWRDASVDGNPNRESFYPKQTPWTLILELVEMGGTLGSTRGLPGTLY